MSVTFTSDQLRAIEAQSDNILVAAAAGSGKTAVLVERIITNILQSVNRDEGYEIDEILVATFTNASARDMKNKIEVALTNALDNESDASKRYHLNEQLLKLNNAHISTLHSFCLYLIQNHYHLLGLTPNMRTIDTVEEELLIEKTIQSLIEKELQDNNHSFIEVVHMFVGNNDMTNFIKIVKGAYRSIIANADVEAFINGMKDQYIDENFIESLLNDYVNMIDELLKSIVTNIETLEELVKSPGVESDFLDNEKKRQYTNLIKSVDSVSSTFKHYSTQLNLNEFSQMKLTEFTNTVKSNISSFVHDTRVEKSEMLSCIEIHNLFIKDLSKRRVTPNVSLTDDIKDMNSVRNAFIDFLSKVIQSYQQYKQSHSIMDFSDYEHYALRILDDEATRHLYQEKFKEIMIDEYQDTNRVQEAILQKLKSKGHNRLFMVGDIKQSIYRFRQADPSIFNEKFNRFKEGIDGELITLNNNFRSTESVIDITNTVFNIVMDNQVGEVDYDDSQRLVYSKMGDVSIEDSKSYVEIYERTDGLNDFRERYVIERIQNLVNQGAKYKDIVVLTRAKSHHKQLQQQMNLENIPSHIESDSGYFESIEIRTIKSVLSIIDNPYQDDHLVGVMRLPYFDISLNDIAKLKLQNGSGYLYERLLEILGDNNETELNYNLKHFVDTVEKFKSAEATMSVYELIDYIYDELSLIEFFSAMYNGEVRRANLIAFKQKSLDFEAQKHITLYEFLSYISTLLEEDKDLGEESILTDQDDVVRIMTIHKSKGLEFKNVIYYHLEKQIESNASKYDDIIFSNDYGLAMKTYDLLENTILRNIHTTTMSYRLKKDLYSEEIRLMYVAFTRAENSLILPLVYKQEPTAFYTLDSQYSHVIDKNVRLNMNSFRDYLYPVLHRIAHKAIDVSQQVDVVALYDDETEETEKTSRRETLQEVKKFSETLRPDDLIIDRLSYRYHNNEGLLGVVHKESVTDIKRRNETLPEDAQPKFRTIELRQPNFMATGVENAALGTYMHEFMMHIVNDRLTVLVLDEEDRTEYLENLLDYLFNNVDIITKEIGDNFVHFAKRFLDDEKMFRLLSDAKNIYTERPFIMSQSAIAQGQQPLQMVQGIIDVIIELDDKYVIIDYKTDYVGPHMTEKVLLDKYSVQMTLYKNSLQQIIGENGKVEVYLYYFNWKYGAIKADV